MDMNSTNNGSSLPSDLYTYYYYYDEGADMAGLSTEELKSVIPVAIIYGIIFLLGVTGNSLVIYCVAKYKRMKKSITNQLLLSLACADLLLTLVCVPIKVWTWWLVFCWLVYIMIIRMCHVKMIKFILIISNCN